MITLVVANRQGNVASMLRVWCLQEARVRAEWLAAELAAAKREIEDTGYQPREELS